MRKVYATFEELVADAKAEGVQYMTMGNYHEGAFWSSLFKSEFSGSVA